jgi:hypothetical protein
MTGRSVMVALSLGAMVLGGALPAAAQAEDFLSALFGGISAPQSRAPKPYIRLPFSDDDTQQVRLSRREEASGGNGGQAWCVRSCDGRYFPLSAPGNESKASTLCNNFCPAAKTEVVYGGSIDDATTEEGKNYSSLPNAFRYRTELVDGCTCNGKDHFGLAALPIENDPTLRKGDIVASNDGLMIVSRSAGKRASANFSPAPASLRAKYQRVPLVASE